jgi:hypothetical protein
MTSSVRGWTDHSTISRISWAAGDTLPLPLAGILVTRARHSIGAPLRNQAFELPLPVIRSTNMRCLSVVKFAVLGILFVPLSVQAQSSGGGGSAGGSAGGASSGGSVGSPSVGSSAVGSPTSGSLGTGAAGANGGQSSTGVNSTPTDPTGFSARPPDAPGYQAPSANTTGSAPSGRGYQAPGTNSLGTSAPSGSPSQRGAASTTTGIAGNRAGFASGRIDGTTTQGGPDRPGDAEMRAEDRKLDQKIKSICRGC